MKKVNRFVVSAIAGFFITSLIVCFVMWKLDPALMTEEERGASVFLSLIGAFLGVCFYGMSESFND